MWWGYSPAIDFQKYLYLNKGEELPVLNILLVSGSDARHILQTLAKIYTHPKRKINIYVVEPLIDFVAKQLLLLLAALEPPEVLGLQEKVRLWMEIYGNLLVRPATVNYIMQKSRQLILMTTDESYLDFRLPLVKLNQMKFKEIDALENIFRFWEINGQFNSAHMWDIRLRRSLGVRYDSRDGLFDWDYQMKLRNMPGAERINYQEYKHWRETGVAFTWVETESVEANLTFASGVMAKGEKLVSLGYMGDIVNGPFVALGIDCEDEEMLKTHGGVCVKRAADIMERNLMRIFYEIEQGQPYQHQSGAGDDEELGVVVREMSRLDVNKIMETSSPRGDHGKGDATRKEKYSAIYVPKVRVHFLPCASLKQFPHSAKFQSFFNMVYLSATSVKMFGPHLNNLIQPEATVLVESKKYIVGMEKKEMTEFEESVHELAKQNGWTSRQPFDPFKDNLAIFKKLNIDKKHEVVSSEG